MKKAELKEALQETIRTEETATALYLEHLSAITLRSGLGEKDMETVRSRMNQLIGFNRAHREELINIIDRIEAKTADDF